MLFFSFLGPLALNLYSRFESNENLIQTIRAYLCYTCFSWLNPLYISLSKKINMPVNRDNDNKEFKNNSPEEMMILIHQFQQLYDNYVHDIMNTETVAYFKAKKEIERINELLTTTGFLPTNIEGKFLISYNVSLF